MTDKMPQPVYIAGPMTGYEDMNYPAFTDAELALRALGYEKIENPFHDEDDPEDQKPWDFYMRRALAQVIMCNSMVLLPGWQKSKGASLEHYVAVNIGIEVVEMTTLLMDNA